MKIDHKHNYKWHIKYCLDVTNYKHGIMQNFKVISKKFNIVRIYTNGIIQKLVIK